MTKAERDAMERHEEKMRQPVSVLFPRTTEKLMMTCKWCGLPFAWKQRIGKRRAYCNERCRDMSSRRRHR